MIYFITSSSPSSPMNLSFTQVLAVDPRSAKPFEPVRPPDPWIPPWAREVISRWGPPALTAMAHLASATAHLAIWYYS